MAETNILSTLYFLFFLVDNFYRVDTLSLPYGNVMKKNDIIMTAMSLVEDDICTIEGVCIKCGAVIHGVEPDAMKYKCETCETDTVYGAHQILLMFG